MKSSMKQALQRALAACAAGVMLTAAQAEDLVIAQVGPFTNMPSPDAREVRDGALAYFDEVNRRSGGVQGRKLSLVTLDDGFSGTAYLERFQEALAKRPVAMITPIGSSALSALFKSRVLDTADIVVVGAIPGAEAFRDPGHPKLFHVRAGDKAQLERILRHCRTLGVARIHVLRQDAAVGEAGLAVLLPMARDMGGFTVTTTSAKHDDADLLQAARESAAQKTQGVILIGAPRFMADALAQLRKAGATQATFALSYLPTPMAVKIAGDGAQGLAITQAFPNPNGQNLPLQRDFHAAMRKAQPELSSYSPFHLEGYVTARVLVEGLRRVEGKPTPAGLARALRDMGEVDLGGFRINFAKGNVGSSWSDIGVVSASGRLVY